MKRILLIITGSIAAVKCPEIIRLLKERGCDVTCVLTKAGEEFVTPLSLASLTGNKVYTELFSAEEETEMDHIQLSREADLLLVAPASANTIAKLAQGLAEDLASTLLLATDKPVMVAPAMNVKMWEHPATQRNVKQIEKDGALLIGPAEGELACGEEGFGRMVEPEEIASRVEWFFAHVPQDKPLQGKKALVTSGPTHEAIDPVRYITNRSSGKQGYAIAAVLAELGAQVTLISGPTGVAPPENVKLVKVESAREMLDASYKALPVDIAVCAAAVSDWRATEVKEEKIKKSGKDETQMFTFMENPDILECISKDTHKRPALVVGFAAETQDVVQHATAKRERKGCDWMLANDVSDGKVFGEDKTAITFMGDRGNENWGALTKVEAAQKLGVEIVSHFAADSGSVVELKRKA